MPGEFPGAQLFLQYPYQKHTEFRNKYVYSSILNSIFFFFFYSTSSILLNYRACCSFVCLFFLSNKLFTRQGVLGTGITKSGLHCPADIAQCWSQAQEATTKCAYARDQVAIEQVWNTRRIQRKKTDSCTNTCAFCNLLLSSCGARSD